MKHYHFRIVKNFAAKGAKGLIFQVEKSLKNPIKHLSRSEFCGAFSGGLGDLLAKEHERVLRKIGKYEGEASLNFSNLYLGEQRLIEAIGEMIKTTKLYFKADCIERLSIKKNIYCQSTCYPHQVDTELFIDSLQGKISLTEDKTIVFLGSLLLVWGQGELIALDPSRDLYWVKELLKSASLSPRDYESLKRELAQDAFFAIELQESSSQKTAEIQPSILFKNKQAKLFEVFFLYPGQKRFFSYETIKEQQGQHRDFQQEKAYLQDLFDLGAKWLDNQQKSLYISHAWDQDDLDLLEASGWVLYAGDFIPLIASSDLSATLGVNQGHWELDCQVSYPKRACVGLKSLLPAMEKGELWVEQEDALVRVPQKQVKQALQGLDQWMELGDSKLQAPLFMSDLFTHSQNDSSEIEFLDSAKEFLKAGTSDDVEAVTPLLFSAKLRHYQQEGVEWLCRLRKKTAGAILADEMGLGKTLQVLAFFSTLGKQKKHLVLCPKMLLKHWEKEAAHFLPQTPVFVFDGNPESLDSFQEGILLCSYSRLRISGKYLSCFCFDTLICDEAHYLKNAQTQLVEASRVLMARFRVCLSGTPIENRPEEALALMSFLFPNEANKLAKLMEQGLALGQLLSFCMLRRKKQEVLKELPEKIEHIRWVSLSDQELEQYDQLLNKKDNQQKRAAALEKLLRLRQFCCHPHLLDLDLSSSKLIQLIDDLREIRELGQKALVFSQFSSVLELIAREIESVFAFTPLLLHGKTPQNQRDKIIDAFQTSEKESLLLLSLKLGGVGLNLTRADHVLLYDPWWNNAAESQAVDRAHRIGREKVVMTTRYLVANTVEERMLELKERKQELAQQVFNEHEQSLSEEDLDFLLS